MFPGFAWDTAGSPIFTASCSSFKLLSDYFFGSIYLYMTPFTAGSCLWGQKLTLKFGVRLELGLGLYAPDKQATRPTLLAEAAITSCVWGIWQQPNALALFSRLPRRMHVFPSTKVNMLQTGLQTDRGERRGSPLVFSLPPGPWTTQVRHVLITLNIPNIHSFIHFQLQFWVHHQIKSAQISLKNRSWYFLGLF